MNECTKAFKEIGKLGAKDFGLKFAFIALGVKKRLEAGGIDTEDAMTAVLIVTIVYETMHVMQKYDEFTKENIFPPEFREDLEAILTERPNGQGH